MKFNDKNNFIIRDEDIKNALAQSYDEKKTNYLPDEITESGFFFKKKVIVKTSVVTGTVDVHQIVLSMKNGDNCYLRYDKKTTRDRDLIKLATLI